MNEGNVCMDLKVRLWKYNFSLISVKSLWNKEISSSSIKELEEQNAEYLELVNSSGNLNLAEQRKDEVPFYRDKTWLSGTQVWSGEAGGDLWILRAFK